MDFLNHLVIEQFSYIKQLFFLSTSMRGYVSTFRFRLNFFSGYQSSSDSAILAKLTELIYDLTIGQ